MSWMQPVAAMNAQCGWRESSHYKLKAKNCRAVCTKKSGLSLSGHSYS